MRGSLNSIVRNKTFLQLLTLIPALLFSSFALAEDRVSLPDVVVTSKPVDGFNQTLNDTHLNQDDLQRSGQREITNILRATPGLALSQGMKGGASTISLRGASGSVGLVNIDGIPLHDTWPGALNLDLFPAETFGSTDIQRGSAAIINFGRSLGGMINLHSRNNRDNAAKLHLEGGSWGSLRETVTADLNNDHHGLNLTAGRDDLFDGTHWADSRQGNSERDDFHAYQLAMHLRDQFSEQIKLDSSVYYINNDSGVDKIGLIRFNPPELNNVDDPGRLKQEIWLTQSTASIDLHPKWHSELQLGYTEHHASAVIGDLLPGSAPYLVGASSTSYRWRAGKTVTVSGWMPHKRGFQFNWGGEGLYEQGRSVSTDMVGQRGTGGGFANVQGNWDDWQGTLAVRADHFDRYGAHTVYHAGLNWQMTQHWQWFISGGTGYRLPSFNEMLMWPFANLQLKPERSVGGDTGLRWQPDDDTQLSVNYFHNHYTGLIKAERVAFPLGLYLLNNIPHARIQGLETQWLTQWNSQLTTGADYTWTDSKNLDTGAPLPRQPKHITRLWLEWSWQSVPLKLWTQGIYRGKSFDTGGLSTLADSFNLDMMLSYQLSKPLNIYLRGDNLTNNRQTQLTGWDTPGAAVYGGLKWVMY